MVAKCSFDMKRFYRMFAVAVGMAVAVLSAADAEAYSPELDGTMMPYSFTRQSVAVPWDSTYTPVLMEYVARHGARYLSSEKKVAELRKVLAEGEQDRSVSKLGKKFLKLISEVEDATAGNWGGLSPLGVQEERKLGRELADIAPEGFYAPNGLGANPQPYANIAAFSSYVPRVVKSMYETSMSLDEAFPDVNITTTEGPALNPMLRFFETDPKFTAFLKDGAWKQVYCDFAGRTIPTGPASRMLPHEKDSLKLQSLTMDAYGILQGLRASGVEADASEWFTEDEYRACWEVANLKHYLQRSANPVSPVPLEGVKTLLATLSNNLTQSFYGYTGVANVKTMMYFGHAETLIPLFAAMKLPGCYAPDCNPEEVASRWKDWEVAPLGANLLIVGLQDKDNGQYVALRLNGNWISIEGKYVIPWRFLQKVWASQNPLQGGVGLQQID